MVAAMMLLACANAAGQVSALRFDKDAKSLTWAELGGGGESVSRKARIGLCNSGSTTASAIRLVPLHFGFTRGETALRKRDVLIVKGPKRLTPSKCATVRFHAGRETPGEGQSFEGTIRAISPSGGEASFNLTVSGPAAPAKVPPAAAAPKQQLNAVRAKLDLDGKRVGTSTVLGDPQAVLLRAPPKGATVATPAMGTVIGVLTAGSDTAVVSVSGKPTAPAEGVSRLPIKVDGLGRGATYDGTLTLTGQDNADVQGAPTVDFEVVVQDDIIWAIAAILGGLLLAAGAAVLLRRWMPLMYFRSDLKDAAMKLNEGAKVFDDYRNTKSFLGYSGPSPGVVDDWRDEVGAERDKLKTASFLLDPEGSDWKALRQHIADAVADADSLKGHGDYKLGEALTNLRDKRTRLNSFLSENFTDQSPPALLQPINLLLHGMPLKVGDPTRIAKASKASEALIDAWRDLAEKYIGLKRWADAIVDNPDWSDEDRGRVGRLRRRLEDVGAALLDVVKSEEQISDERISEKLQRSLRDLGVLRRKRIAIPPTPSSELLTDVAVRNELFYAVEQSDRRVTLLDRARTPALRGPTLSPDDQLAALRKRFQERKLDAISATSSRILEVLILLIALILAVLAGLQQVYFDQSFGTIQDYLGLVLLGTATGVVTPFLASAAKSLGTAGSHLSFLRRAPG